MSPRALLAAACLALASGPVAAQIVRLAPVPQDSSEDRPTLAPLLREVTPAVVNIAVTSTEPVPQNPLFADPFFRRFFELPEEAPAPTPHQSVGSGVIVDAAQGYVLTNHHVVADADEIVVTLTDRRTLTAELVGSDEGTDIALLKVPSESLTQVQLANSDELEVGDFVVAIGNPFGLGQTVTSGIVSALGRSGINIEGYEDFIQTDASINPGNSGGALIDLNGELVGINTAILSPSGGGNVGIGFAVPSNMAKQVMMQLAEYGEVRRGRLGVMIQAVTPELAEALELSVNEGAVVTGVEPGSAGERAGVEAGDVVVEFNGEPVTSAADLRNKVGLAPIGTRVPLTVLRSGERRELTAEIEAAPSAAAERGGAPGTEQLEQLAGVQFRDLMPGDPQYGEVQGVLVAALERSSAAARAGLRPGDIVVGVNRTAVKSADELARALGAAEGAVALNIVRGDGRLYIVVR